MTNAKKKIMAIKSIFEGNALLQAMFPEILPRGNKPWSSDCLMLNRSSPEPEGTFEPAGTGTNVVSRHYDEVIEDDTVAPDYDAMTGEIQQPTAAEIEKAIGFHKLCHPLLLHPAKSCITVIGTRWAPDDLIEWIFKHGKGYSVQSRSCRERDGIPASPEQGGVAVWPERFDEDVLQELTETIGPFMFDMLYMNSPTASVNQVFKREYIEYYSNLPTELLYFTSLDPAPPDSESKTLDADYNAIVTSALKPSTGEVWLVHYDRLRADPGKVIDVLFNHWRAYSPVITSIEKTAYQSTLMYWIRRRQEQNNERFYIEGVANAKTSKNARILGLQPWFAAHKVHIRREHADAERELLAFNPSKKYGGHDDIIDGLSMHVPNWTNACKTYKIETAKTVVINPFSGQTIIDELLGRAAMAHQYPYDMGHMDERLSGVLPRDDYIFEGRRIA
jgi:predicted phage terminase large subunit-like protein